MFCCPDDNLIKQQLKGLLVALEEPFSPSMYFFYQTKYLIYYIFLVEPFSFPYISSIQTKAQFLNIFAYKCTDGYNHKEKKQTLPWNEAVNHLRIVVLFI